MIPRILGLLTAALLLVPGAARAIDIQEVTSPGGIDAWLVEDASIPFVAIEIWFNGGASLDAPGKRGAVHLMTGSAGGRRRGHGRPRLRRRGGGAGRKLRVRRLSRRADGLGPHADGKPRGGRRSAARGPCRAPFRRGRGGTGARSGPVDHRRRRARPRRDRGPDLQRDGLGRSPLWQRAGRHSGKRQCADPRRPGWTRTAPCWHETA
jgi:hypothetical protein